MVYAQLYQQIIGSLLYLALHTRLDILPAVSILSRFQKAPTAYCHRAAKHVLRYLRGTSSYVVKYQSDDLDVNAFVDSDYAGDVKDRKSMSGFIIRIGSGPVSWSSKKQGSVALSTCEAEYYAMTDASKEVIWIRRVLQEIGTNINYASIIRSDNLAALEWTTSEHPPSARTKHIDVRLHLIRDLVHKCSMIVVHVATDRNDADILTKPVGYAILRKTLNRIGLGALDAEEC